MVVRAKKTLQIQRTETRSSGSFPGLGSFWGGGGSFLEDAVLFRDPKRHPLQKYPCAVCPRVGLGLRLGLRVTGKCRGSLALRGSLVIISGFG